MELREQHLQAQEEAAEIEGRLSTKHAITQIMHIESVRHRYKKIAYFFRHKLDCSLKNIKVSTNEDPTQWKTIQNKEEMEYHILQHSKKHFRQAEGSIPTIPPMVNIIGDG